MSNTETPPGTDVEGSAVVPGLLDRLRAGNPAAWERFVRLYGPVVYRWCRHEGLSPAEAVEAGMRVFQAVALHVAAVPSDPTGRGPRDWLRTFAELQLLKCSTIRRPEGPGWSGDDGAAEDFRDLARLGVALMRDEWEESGRADLHDGPAGPRPPGQGSDEVGRLANRVLVARALFLRQLRDEYAGLIDVEQALRGGGQGPFTAAENSVAHDS